MKSLFSFIGHVAQEVKEGREGGEGRELIDRVTGLLQGRLTAKEYNHKFTIFYEFVHLKYCLQNNKIKVM